MTTQRSGAGIGMSLDEMTRTQFRKDAGITKERESGEDSYLEDFSLDDFSTNEMTNRFSRKRKFGVDINMDVMADPAGKCKYDVNMSLDEIAEVSGKRKYDINMSLDEIARLSKAGKPSIGGSFDGRRGMRVDLDNPVEASLDDIVASGRGEIDYVNASLAEVIQHRNIEAPPRPRWALEERAKKSKWDRYNKSDNEEEEEDLDFVPAHISSDEEEEPVQVDEEEETESTFVPAQIISCFDDEEDEEPISLPMHAGQDDEDPKEVASDNPFSNEEAWF